MKKSKEFIKDKISRNEKNEFRTIKRPLYESENEAIEFKSVLHFLMEHLKLLKSH
jgi:hypothetical protein